MLSTCLVTRERMITKRIHDTSIRQRLGEKIGNYSLLVNNIYWSVNGRETTRAVEVKETEYFPRDTYEVCV